MRTELLKVLSLKQYFNIVSHQDNLIRYSLEKPSKILLQNIYANWLHSVLAKTQKYHPVYLGNHQDICNKIPYGFICQPKIQTKENVFEQNLNETFKESSELKFNLVVPEQDAMPYFIKWQRYRKFWWSSITTTPSLFGIDDIKHGKNTADVNIVARFPWGTETVETLNMTLNADQNSSHLVSSLGFNKSLFILLSDGLNNKTKEGYLRLHRTMAPYKISFAVCEDFKSKENLNDLARLLYYRLSKNRISSWLPDFSLDTESQLKESLDVGVAYTALLSEGTLADGIFHLLNSSTMLKEQIHVADFDTYVSQICRK